jgi:hypothetical protein
MRALTVSLVVVSGVLIAMASCGNVQAQQPDASPAMPDAGAGCMANAFSCGTDNALYQCDAEGAALGKVQDCQYGCTVDRCNECAANTTFCSGDDLVMCDGTGTIVNPQTCQYGCQADRCNTCDPGVAYCDGATAVTCGSNGMPSGMMNCGAAGCAGGVCNACTPNTTTCQGDTLVVCNGAGTVQSTTPCSLGCTTSPTTHCKALVPSYGVPGPSGTLSNLLVDANATLDLTNCPNSVGLTIGMISNTLVGAPQVSGVNQTGGPPICVVRFGTITINAGVSLTIVNNSAGHVLSLQATGDIQIDGTIAFTNNAPGPSPGGDGMVFGTKSDGDRQAAGGGGGGAAYAGGVGGDYNPDATILDRPGGAGGAVVTTISTRLTAGSAGGHVKDGTANAATGGQGGGAVHLVSLTRVILSATAVINLNGFGGAGIGFGHSGDLPAAGGGAGGTLVVEAPTLSVSAGAIAAANGGGGAGGCYSCSSVFCAHTNGQNGQLSSARAAGGDCAANLGDGGYEANGTAMPYDSGWPSDQAAATVSGGGGGGSRGFIILRGRSASSVMIAGGAVVSPMPTLGSVTAN